MGQETRKVKWYWFTEIGFLMTVVLTALSVACIIVHDPVAREKVFAWGNLIGTLAVLLGSVLLLVSSRSPGLRPSKRFSIFWLVCVIIMGAVYLWLRDHPL